MIGRQPSISDPRFDWRDKGLVVQNSGIVTAAKDQGTCGCCWAFATIGTVEAAYARSNILLIAASDQYLLNESGKYFATSSGPYGCPGGWWVFDMLVPRAIPALSEAGVPRQDALPYQELPGSTPISASSFLTSW